MSDACAVCGKIATHNRTDGYEFRPVCASYPYCTPEPAAKPGEARSLPEWRTGRKLGRTLYQGEKFVGIMDTPEDAMRVVLAVNADEDDLIGEMNASNVALEAQLAEVRAENERLAAALKFYSTSCNWYGDNGHLAREALAARGAK